MTGNSRSYELYDLFIDFFEIIFHVFFRTIRLRGAWRIPREGPVIFVGAPHANQFVDPIMIGIQVSHMAGRRPSFLMAEKSYNHPVIGRLSRFMRAIPVGRAQDSFKAATGEIAAKGGDSLVIYGRGTRFLEECTPGTNISLQNSNDLAPVKEVLSDTELVLAKPFRSEEGKQLLKTGFEPRGFKVGERVDNTNMFIKVFDHLARGHTVGIFPEGGSHDRPEMLPLKPGVAIMALGTVAQYPGTKVAIVPVGLNYFHPHKFRSRAVIEFGDPLFLDDALVKKYVEGGPEGKKDSVAELMGQIVDALQLVTINTPDFETLMVVQAGQRLYKPHQDIPLPLTIEFTRRFVQGFLQYREKDPRMVELYNDVKRYNDQLLTMGISDHQVPLAVKTKAEVFRRLIARVATLIILSIASLPGLVLGSPVLVATKLISKLKAKSALAASSVKIQANDVIATWKIMVSLLLVPMLFSLYSLFDCWYVFVRAQWLPLTAANGVLVFSVCFWGLLAFSYATIIVGEAGLDIARSIKPLYLALSPYHQDTLEQIRQTRAKLVVKITDLVNELGPQLFPDIAERLEKGKVKRISVDEDPRIDIRALNSSLNLKGDYDLAKVPIFSTDKAPATLPRRRRK